MESCFIGTHTTFSYIYVVLINTITLYCLGETRNIDINMVLYNTANTDLSVLLALDVYAV